MAEQKRVRRTPEKIAADIDGQISKLEENIRGLEEKKIAACAEFDAKIAAVQEKAAKLAERKKEVLSPKKRKPRKSKAERIRELVKQAQKSGMKLDEIAESWACPFLSESCAIAKSRCEAFTAAFILCPYAILTVSKNS